MSGSSSKYLEFWGGREIGVPVEEFGSSLLGVEADPLAGIVFLQMVPFVSADALIGVTRPHTRPEKEYTQKRNEKSDAKFILQELEFDEILSSDEGLYNYLSMVNKYGVVKVVNAPGESGAMQLANRISFCMESFFGSSFDVLVVDDPINLAYSGQKLKYHTDLPFYSHVPGLQHLHCIRNDSCVSGGLLTLKDIYEIAEKFRRDYPEFFYTLSRVSVVFQHITFKLRTLMENCCTTITLDNNNEISGIRWNPSVQGPVVESNDASTLDAYFRAFIQFNDYVESYPPK
ncbi:Gamma-butyrobetaine dioxygenase-like, partial [Oopsacas minuta]